MGAFLHSGESVPFYFIGRRLYIGDHERTTLSEKNFKLHDHVGPDSVGLGGGLTSYIAKNPSKLVGLLEQVGLVQEQVTLLK